MVLHLLFGAASQRFALPACGRSVDSAWEQEKLEARKMPENAADSHTSGACFVRCGWTWRLTGWKGHRRQLHEILTHNFDFGNCVSIGSTTDKKHDLSKHQITKSQLWPTKTKLIQQLAGKMKTKIYQNHRRKKPSQFWEPAKPTTNKAEEKNLCQRDLPKRHAK